jgi:hypothetical protein
VIKVMPVDLKFGWLPVWVAMADGEREGAILATLSENEATLITERGEYLAQHVLELLRKLDSSPARAALTSSPSRIRSRSRFFGSGRR